MMLLQDYGFTLVAYNMESDYRFYSNGEGAHFSTYDGDNWEGYCGGKTHRGLSYDRLLEILEVYLYG